MDKNNRFYDDENIPACRFGPGGDFVSDWPRSLRQNYGQAGPIAKVLKAISKMLDVVITEELLQKSTLEKINQAINNKSEISNLKSQIPCMEDKIVADKSIEPDAPSTAGLEADRQLQKEPMLFNHACGAVTVIRNKPHHGIRAYRRPKRKRPSFVAIRQGSLFEPYAQSSKVA